MVKGVLPVLEASHLLGVEQEVARCRFDEHFISKIMNS